MTAHLIPINVVKWATRLVDTSGVLDKVCIWEREDRKYRGGRPTTLNVRATLIAWLIVAFEQQPLYSMRVAEVLSTRMSPEAAAIMGAPEDYATAKYADMQNRVERATNRLMAVMDSKPLKTRQRRLLKGELPAMEEDRALRADELEDKRQRMFRFANDLLHAQFDSLPDSAKSHRLSLSIDATFLESPSRGMSKATKERRRDDQTVALDPDAGWYIRTYDQRDSWDGSETHARKLGYGYEAELAVLVSNDSEYRESVPHIVVGFNFHKAGADSNLRAREIFDDILAWGHGFGFIISDQAYLPNSNPNVLQAPLRDAGALLSMRYPIPSSVASKGEGTKQAVAHGAFMLEGRWMCPATPMTHRDIMVRYNKAVQEDKKNPKLTKAMREERELSHRQRRYAQLRERAKWELGQKDKQANGNLVMTCPASGSNRHLDCPLKPNEPAPKAGVDLMTVENTPKMPGDICTNKSSVTFEAEHGAKYRQHHRYGTAEWDEMHTYGRQTVESFNNALKHADNSLKDSTNRRLRGEANQSFLAILSVVAQNARNIYTWLEDEYDEGRPAQEPRTRQKRTNHLAPVVRTGTRKKKSRDLSASRRARYGLIPA